MISDFGLRIFHCWEICDYFVVLGFGDGETLGQGDLETRGLGDKETEDLEEREMTSQGKVVLTGMISRLNVNLTRIQGLEMTGQGKAGLTGMTNQGKGNRTTIQDLHRITGRNGNLLRK